MIGPYPAREILLLSADASPNSQRKEPSESGFFFRRANWVGAVRNAAERNGCDFLILTTKYGLVASEDVISPYDFHIDVNPVLARKIWTESFARSIPKGRYKLMLFYAGGCPREAYLKIIIPLCRAAGIEVLTFGKPNMYDTGKLDQVVEMTIAGTTLEGLKGVLNAPDRLEYFSVTG